MNIINTITLQSYKCNCINNHAKTNVEKLTTNNFLLSYIQYNYSILSLTVMPPVTATGIIIYTVSIACSGGR